MKLGGGKQECQVPLHITLIAPDDLHTLEIDEDFKVEDNDGSDDDENSLAQCNSPSFDDFHIPQISSRFVIIDGSDDEKRAGMKHYHIIQDCELLRFWHFVLSSLAVSIAICDVIIISVFCKRLWSIPQSDKPSSGRQVRLFQSLCISSKSRIRYLCILSDSNNSKGDKKF